MAPEDETEDVTEHNEFRDTLLASKGVVEGCGDNVYNGRGSPLDAIATPIASGGWVCTEADEWTVEMTEQCAGITEAFDDAAQHIQQRIGKEPLRVPENDPHGKAWPRTWSYRHNF